MKKIDLVRIGLLMGAVGTLLLLLFHQLWGIPIAAIGVLIFWLGLAARHN